LVEPYLEECCGDVRMGSVAPTIRHTDSIYTEPLDSTPISSLLLPTTPSYVHGFHKFLEDIIGYYPSIDPCCGYLEDMPRKIMWIPFFDHAFDFSMAFGKFKRPLTLFS